MMLKLQFLLVKNTVKHGKWLTTVFFQNHSGFTALPLSFRCMYLQCGPEEASALTIYNVGDIQQFTMRRRTI